MSLPADAGDTDSVPSLGRSPGEGNGNPFQYSCLENPKRRLVGYSPWGCKRVRQDLVSKKQMTTVVTRMKQVSVLIFPWWNQLSLFLAFCLVCIASSNIGQKEVLPLIISEMMIYSISLVLILHPWSQNLTNKVCGVNIFYSVPKQALSIYGEWMVH